MRKFLTLLLLLAFLPLAWGCTGQQVKRQPPTSTIQTETRSIPLTAQPSSRPAVVVVDPQSTATPPTGRPTSRPVIKGITSPTGKALLTEFIQCRKDRAILAQKLRDQKKEAALDKQTAVKEVQLKYEGCEKKRKVEAPGIWLKVGVGVAVAAAAALTVALVAVVVERDALAGKLKEAGLK